MKDAIKELEELMDRKKEQQYPNIPEHARVKSKARDDDANNLTRAILSWLELNGHKAWRQSSEGRYRSGKQYTDVIGHRKQLRGHYIPGTNKGHSDVQSIINGLFVAWEVKMKDKQSPAQKKFQQELEASGGRYFITHSFDEFMKQYKSINK
jgi:hypothetical protein